MAEPWSVSGTKMIHCLLERHMVCMVEIFLHGTHECSPTGAPPHTFCFVSVGMWEHPSTACTYVLAILVITKDLYVRSFSGITNLNSSRTLQPSLVPKFTKYTQLLERNLLKFASGSYTFEICIGFVL